MGVNFKDIVEARSIDVKELEGKTIAVDSLNWIFQFISTIRQRDGGLLMDSKGRTTSHLSGLFYRCALLLKNNIKPVFVFDGEAPSFKKETQEKRRESKRIYEEKYDEAIKVGDYDLAKSFSSRTAKVNDDIISSSNILNSLLSLKWINIIMSYNPDVSNIVLHL